MTERSWGEIGGSGTGLSLAWSPLALPNLVAWYDASNAASIASSGGAVSQLNDLSGHGFHLTVTVGSGAPTTGTHTLNGRNTITFTAASTTELGATITSQGGNTGTWYAVMVPSGSDSFGRVVGLTNGGNDYDNTGSIAAILRDGSNTSFASYYNNAERAIQACSNAAHHVTTQRNADSNLIWVDGAAGTPATGLGTSVFAITQIYVGAQGAGNGPISMDLAELVWSKDADSAATVALANAYFKAKWATP